MEHGINIDTDYKLVMLNTKDSNSYQHMSLF
jgi:hypothetical protein